MKTYNGLAVPNIIHSSKTISAFENDIDKNSLDYYRGRDLSQVDAITGYPSIIDEDDIGKLFVSGEEVEAEHIGQRVWYVTDGHHRSIVGCEQGINLAVELDYSTITDAEELKAWTA